MGDTTHISWCDGTWSPWTGCAKVSPACDGCYAAHLMDTRMGRVEWGEPGLGEGTRDLMSDAYWRKAIPAGLVFPSLCDPFDLAVPDAWHKRFHQKILDTPHVHWLLLTKRVGNVRKVADAGHGLLWEARNWSLGSTFANQAEWDRDYWKLRDTSAAFEVLPFGSFEPLLSAIDFHAGWMPGWVIAGGETDQGAHKARPAHPDWIRGLRDQCAMAEVPFHFKQWGEWAPRDDHDEYEDAPRSLPMRHLGHSGWTDTPVTGAETFVLRIGKRKAGRALDGVIHDARPALTRSHAALGDGERG